MIRLNSEAADLLARGDYALTLDDFLSFDLDATVRYALARDAVWYERLGREDISEEMAILEECLL